MEIKSIKKFIILILIFLFCKAGFCDEKLKISVTNPWLALLASFVGGAEAEIIPLRIWNQNGDLILSERGKILKELEDGAKIIALDENDSQESGIKQPENFTIKFLYSPFPVDITSLSDPSVLPFVAQRILTALSEWDVQNYPYYQRRLAEFQARLSGSILVGQVLKDVTICDMGGSCGILLRAAGCNVERPDEIEKWNGGNFSGLREYLENKKAQGVITVYDDDTPKPLKRYLSGRSDSYHWERPSMIQDYPTFLHEQYISLWQKIIKKPLPVK